MKIRAITLGHDIYADGGALPQLRQLLDKLQSLQGDLEAVADVEYIRVASPPFDANTTSSEADNLFLNPTFPKQLDELAASGLLGIYSYAPGIADQKGPLTDAQKRILTEIPRLLDAHPNMFSSLQAGSSQHTLNFEAVDHAVDIIFGLAVPDPFRNVQFAATFNVPANTPFFPSAYHIGKRPKLSIALEAADELVGLFSERNVAQTSLYDLKQAIQSRFEAIYSSLARVVEPFCEENRIEFVGIDFSPAPFPTAEKSIGKALEALGFAEFGGAGSVFGVGFITEALKSAACPKIGFSGFMQPLLEDYVIARRNNEHKVDISKLLLYSTMCGLGLDCVPIPGDTPKDAVKLLLLDLGMLSLRLDKPLTARLMPIPGQKLGALTQFDFDYFTNSEICGVDYFPNHTWEEIRKHNQGYNLTQQKSPKN